MTTDIERVLRGDKNLYKAYLPGANLVGADLTGANLVGADLSRTDLTGANLSKADLRGANLEWAWVAGASLRGANLKGANLSWTDLSRASMAEANLEKADVRWAGLAGADLAGANLRNADLRLANLRGADLSGTCLDPRAAVPPLPEAETLAKAGLTLLRVDGRLRVCGVRTVRSAHVGSQRYKAGRWHKANALSVDQSTLCHPGVYFGGKEPIGRPSVKCWSYADETVWINPRKGVRARRVWVEAAR